jgi:hypothetical protein
MAEKPSAEAVGRLSLKTREYVPIEDAKRGAVTVRPVGLPDPTLSSGGAVLPCP